MTIYKIRSWSWRVNRKGEYVDKEQNEDIVIDNLDRAKEIYNKHLNEIECLSQYSKHHGRCQLFIPHLFDNGELAYWPDNEKYIEKFEFDN